MNHVACVRKAWSFYHAVMTNQGIEEVFGNNQSLYPREDCLNETDSHT